MFKHSNPLRAVCSLFVNRSNQSLSSALFPASSNTLTPFERFAPCFPNTLILIPLERCAPASQVHQSLSSDLLLSSVCHLFLKDTLVPLERLAKTLAPFSHVLKDSTLVPFERFACCLSNTLLPFERLDTCFSNSLTPSARLAPCFSHTNLFRAVCSLFLRHSRPLRAGSSLLLSSDILIASQVLGPFRTVVPRFSNSLVHFERFAPCLNHCSPCRAVRSLFLKYSYRFRAVWSLFDKYSRPSGTVCSLSLKYSNPFRVACSLLLKHSSPSQSVCYSSYSVFLRRV